jgi:transposase
MQVHDWVTLEALELIERRERDAQRAKRLRIVILAMQGWTAPAIAMSVGLSRRVCQRWIERFNECGLEGLEDQRRSGRKATLTPDQEEQFRERLAAKPTPEDRVCTLRGVDIQRILEVEFGRKRSLAAVYNLLHRLNYSCLRPRPRHHKADPQAQAQFEADLPERLTRIAAVHPDKRVCVYFQDEARFGQQGTTTHIWASKGSRPTAVRQTEYEYLWVLGAVCPETGRAEGLLSPRLNTDVINAFLREFSNSLPDDEHAVLIWDGAGFHTSKKVRVPANVTLIQLPPYSPELNPLENLWHYLKSHYWSNRAYASYADLEATAITTWKTAVLDCDLMKTVCAAPYLKRAISK